LRGGEGFFHRFQAAAQAQAFGFIGVVGARQKRFQVADVTFTQLQFRLLFGPQAGGVPIALEQGFLGEQIAHFLVV